MNLNPQNREQAFLQYKEGALSPEERVAVEQYLAKHPECQADFDLYDPGLRLTEETEDVFPGTIPGFGPMAAPTIAKSPAKHPWRRLAAACAAALLCGTAAIFVLRATTESLPEDTLLAQARQEAGEEALQEALGEPIAPTAQRKSALAALPQRPSSAATAENDIPLQKTENEDIAPSPISPAENTIVYTDQLIAYSEPKAPANVVVYTDRLITQKESKSSRNTLKSQSRQAVELLCCGLRLGSGVTAIAQNTSEQCEPAWDGIRSRIDENYEKYNIF